MNNSLLGIDIVLVKEINSGVEYTAVPGAKPCIAGLFNMRGQVVTLFDLGKLIAWRDDKEKTRDTCIILKAPANDPNQVGFLIDKPGDVIDLEQEEWEIPPANVIGAEVEYINQVVKLHDKLLIILNPERIFDLVSS